MNHVQHDSNQYDTKLIEDALFGAVVGHSIHYFGSVPSTMSIARELAEAGAPAGAVVVAEEQTRGRGRYDRRWETPYGRALLMTVILKAPDLVEPISRLSMLAGVAVAEGIADTAPSLQARVRLKWPNDVLIMLPSGSEAGSGGGKVAGILLESSLTGASIDYALLGIGVNVSQSAAEFAALPPGGGLRPTSLALAAKQPVARNKLLTAICRRMGDWLEQSAAHGSDLLYAHWRALLNTLSADVIVRAAGGDQGAQWQGRAVDVDPDGNLVVRLADGRTRTFSAGDVTLHGSALQGQTE